MKVIAEYRAITYQGESITFNYMHEIDEEFEPINKTIIMNGRETEYNVTVSEQIDESLSDLDKSGLMYEKDLQCIINWEILGYGENISMPTIVNKVNDAREITEQLVIASAFKRLSKDTQKDLYAVYLSMKDSIKGLSITQQVKIVLASTSVAYQSVTTSYQYMIDLMREDTIEDMREMIRLNNASDEQIKLD